MSVLTLGIQFVLNIYHFQTIRYPTVTATPLICINKQINKGLSQGNWLKIKKNNNNK